MKSVQYTGMLQDTVFYLPQGDQQDFPEEVIFEQGHDKHIVCFV